MNYGKLTAGTTKTAIDTAKPSEKGEIITYLSRMGAVLHNVQEWGKFCTLPALAVNTIGNRYKMHSLFPKHDFCVKSYLQIISTDTAHVLYNDCSHLSSFNICKHSLPVGSVKVCASPSIIRVMLDILIPMLFCILCQHPLLIDDTV